MRFFNNPNDELHLTPAQLKSRIAAKKIKASDITMNADHSCDISGSSPEPYHVTLDSCTCQDFQYNKKTAAPCKHIYRLASELGVMDLPKPDPAGKKEINAHIPEELQRWKTAFLSGSISPERYLKLLDAFQTK